MIRRTLKKKPSLIKNKTGKRKNTKGIKRNRRKVYKTRKRKSGGIGHPLIGFLRRVIPDSLKDKYNNLGSKLSTFLVRAHHKTFRRRRRGGGNIDNDDLVKSIITSIENIDSLGKIHPCEHVKILNETYKNLLKEFDNEEDLDFLRIRTALTTKITQLEVKGNCENITTETAEPVTEYTGSEQKTTEEEE